VKRRSLGFRLLVANVAVVSIAAGAFVLTARLLGPELFDTQVQQIGQRFGWSDGTVSPGGGGPGGRGAGQGQSGTGQGQTLIEDELNDAFAGSLTVALIVALGVGIVAALVAAYLVSGRVLRPLDRVRAAVRRMAGGRYDEPVPEPHYAELADLARDVNALGAALEGSEARRARLVSDLAHEMRTPITSLDGFVEGLEDGIFEPGPETLSAMRTETRRLQRLADDLGSLSRAAEESFDLHLERTDLGAIATTAAHAMAANFAASGLTLDVRVIAPLPVQGDPDRLAQVVTNLLRNALRHTPASGTVTVSGGLDDRVARVVVTDTGEGIAEEDLERIFERFYRVRPTAAAAGGSGIGLTIARSIARAHGGDLVAGSHGPGRGAEFRLTVPLDLA
jgi:signal transduction histidine kinase